MSEKFHYWLSATDPETHKPYLVYGCPAKEGEPGARARGIELLGGLDFEIKRLPTRDLGKASSMWKGKRLEQTHNLGRAGQRLGHIKSLRRDQNRTQDRSKKSKTDNSNRLY